MNTFETIPPILIAEDSDDDYEMTLHALKQKESLKNPVLRCEDGQELLDYLKREGSYKNAKNWAQPAFILLDLNMPGLDGRKALREIKNDPDLKHIPIAVVTTSNDMKDVNACYRDGANTYIQKSVDLDNFFEAMKSVKEYWLKTAILPQQE